MGVADQADAEEADATALAVLHKRVAPQTKKTKIDPKFDDIPKMDLREPTHHRHVRQRGSVGFSFCPARES